MLDKTNDLNVIEGGAGRTVPATWEIGVRAVDLHDGLWRVQLRQTPRANYVLRVCVCVCVCVSQPPVEIALTGGLRRTM
jgi:hypothetical protein